METGFMNRIIGLVLALVVGGLLVGGLLIPSIEGMTATEKTFENEGYFYMTKYSSDADLTISWDHATPKVITINEEEIALEGFPLNQWISIVVGNEWMLRYANGGTLYFSQLRYGNMQNMAADTNSGTDMTIVCQNGTATATKYTSGTPGTPVEVSYTEIYAIDNAGDYVMKKSSDTAIMSANSPIIALGTTDLGSGYACVCKITGTIEDGFSPSILASTSGEAAIVPDSVIVNKTAMTEGKGYELSSIQFEISDRGTEYPATYSYFIVPAAVNLELSQHMDATQIAMFGVISILGIVALVVVAANGIRNKY